MPPGWARTSRLWPCKRERPGLQRALVVHIGQAQSASSPARPRPCAAVAAAQVQSTMGTVSLEGVAAAGASAPLLIFQLYVLSDRVLTRSLLQRAAPRPGPLLLRAPGCLPHYPCHFAVQCGNCLSADQPAIVWASTAVLVRFESAAIASMLAVATPS